MTAEVSQVHNKNISLRKYYFSITIPFPMYPEKQALIRV